MPNGQFPALFYLSDINGENGFKIDGEFIDNDSGLSVSGGDDFNGDSHPDILIGAPGAKPNNVTDAGRCYVVWGGPGVGSGGLLNLSSLNSSHGFIMDGETISSRIGESFSGIGDINGDSYKDFSIIGTFSPVNYVVFGGASLGSNGFLNLSDLNGTNGFKLAVGSCYYGCSPHIVDGIGDMNGDSHVDFLTSAQGWDGQIGSSYVIFGKSDVGSQGLITASNLNGTGGFIMTGEAIDDGNGGWISGAGDINGDNRPDIIIGAGSASPGNKTDAGRSYVVFGKNQTSYAGSLLLSSLNGTDGFMLDGESLGGLSGGSVTGIGDINADGIGDLAIGAPFPTSTGLNVTEPGRVYVVFGVTTLGSVNPFLLANLNGSNGFKIYGEIVNDLTGGALSSAGDLNADGYADFLINAGDYNGGFGLGRIYIIFGGSKTGIAGVLNLTDLNGFNGFIVQGDQGYSYPGSLSRGGDINGDQVDDLIIGVPYYYTPDGGYRSGRTYVVFGDAPPVLVNNSLSVVPGSSVILSNSDLAATDRNHQNSSLVFIPSNVTHGQFEWVSNPGTAIVNFSQTLVGTGMIRFVHDGSTQIPSYAMTVRSSGIAWVGPITANVTFVGPRILVLDHNQLSLSNGDTLTLSTTNVQATESDTVINPASLQFFVSNVQNGYFHSAALNLTSFIQQKITDGVIQFTHLGNQQAPSYSVSVSDGTLITPPSPAAIQFTGAPVIVNNTVAVNSSVPVILTPTDLNITVTDGSTSSQVLITISDLQHAQIVQVSNQQPISNFTLANLQSGQIELIHDSSHIAPSYVVTVTTGNGVSSAPSVVESHYSNQGIFAPRLVNNFLFVKQGGSVALTPQNLRANQDNNQPLNDSSAVFLVNSVTHGQFTLVGMPTLQISFFTQQQLQSSEVIFTQDGSRNIPGYLAAVQSQGLQSPSFAAQILFQTVNQPPLLAHSLSDQLAIVGQPFSYALPVDAFTDPEGDAIIYTASRYNSTKPLPSWLTFTAMNSRFSGIPDAPGLIDVNVTAQDAAGLATTTDFSLSVLPAHSQPHNNLTQTIAASVASGFVGLGFLLVQLLLKRASNKKLMQALGDGTDNYDLEVVRPVAKEVACRVKITGCMNYTTNTEMVHFKGAVRTILSELTGQGFNVQEQMATSTSQRDAVINEIATQAQVRLAPKKSACSCSSVVSFFKPQATPEQIREAAPEIATAVAQVFAQRTKTGSVVNPALTEPAVEIELRTIQPGSSP